MVEGGVNLIVVMEGLFEKADLSKGLKGRRELPKRTLGR